MIAGYGLFYTGKSNSANEDLTKMVETIDEWITTRTGIKVRHIAGDNQTTAMLASGSSEKKQFLMREILQPKILK